MDPNSTYATRGLCYGCESKCEYEGGVIGIEDIRNAFFFPIFHFWIYKYWYWASAFITISSPRNK